MKLELGSGYAPTPGYLHMDANPNLPGADASLTPPFWESCARREPHVDIRGDVATLRIWGDNSIDEIRAVDVLEHISYRRTRAVLAEWARVLVPGGRLYVQVPDAGTVIDQWAQYALIEAETPSASAAHAAAGRSLASRIPDGLRTGRQDLDAWNGVQWRLLGGHDDGVAVRDGDDPMLNAHLALFTCESLSWHLQDAGLDVESIETNLHPNFLCWAVKP